VICENNLSLPQTFRFWQNAPEVVQNGHNFTVTASERVGPDGHRIEQRCFCFGQFAFVLQGFAQQSKRLADHVVVFAKQLLAMASASRRKPSDSAELPSSVNTRPSSFNALRRLTDVRPGACV
jgi:hypothetical protein